MVEAQEIDEQTAAGVMEQLAGAAGGAGAEGAAPAGAEGALPPEAAAGALPPEAAAGALPPEAVAAEAAPLPGGGEEVVTEEATEPAKEAAALLASIK